MTSLPPASSREKLEAWLKYYNDLNLGEFYTDRSSIQGSNQNLVGRRAARPALAATIAPESSANSSPKSVLPQRAIEPPKQNSSAAVFPVVPTASLFETMDRVEGDTLEAIREHLGDCTRCRLHKQRNKIVFGAGNPHAQLVFVGEGPGHDEDMQGLPFVGRAGKLLTQMIEAMGLKRDDVYICNVVKCRPPENRKPEEDEVATCSPYLLRQIDVIGPKAIVCLGATAAQALLNTKDSISRFRGQWFDFRQSKLLATYHPAYLLRNPSAKGEVWKDLQKVMELLGLPLRKSPSK